MLMDPSESTFSRVLRWVFWIAIILGLAAYGGIDHKAVEWGIAGAVGSFLAYFIVQNVIVAPLQSQIKELERKIDRLQQIVAPQTDFGED